MKLELTASAWLACAAGIGLWALSVLLTRDAHNPQRWTWRTIPLSFIGLVWIMFGLTFISRFCALAYDPEFFRATQFPIWKIPAVTLAWTWIAITIYWLAFTSSYVVMNRLSPHRPALLGKLDLLASPENLPILDLLVLSSSCLAILSGRQFIPLALRTPIGILGGFYVIAATTVWYDYFQGQPLSLRNFLYLLPGGLIYFFSPFRALIFGALLCVVVPSLKTRRWVSFSSFLLTMLALLLLTTIINDYRRASMKAEVSNRQDPTLTDETLGSKELNQKPSWVRLVNRFHGFDSVALTVHFVPSVFPHSQINIFTDLIRRVIPRAVLDKKSDTHRGQKFSTTIWAMGDRGRVKRQASNISLTMCADLFQINGILLVIVGAAFYGLLVGLLESWQRRGDPLSSCILLALFGMTVALGVEQEFDFACATLIQMTVGLFFFLLLLPSTANPQKTERKLPVKREGLKNRNLFRDSAHKADT
jgi:hypothetical protein